VLARALPDNPYDGHTLRDVIEETQRLTGCEIERAYVDKGYRGSRHGERKHPVKTACQSLSAQAA
jgi:hypothetical protein